MEGGGSEKQLLYLLQRLDRVRFDLHLYLLYRTGFLLQEVPDDVPITAYWSEHTQPRWNWPGRILRDQIRHLSDLLRKESIDVAYDRLFHMTLVTGPATKATKTARASAIVSPPEFDLVRSEKRWLGWKKAALRKAYTSADSLITVAPGVAESASRFYGIPLESFRIVSSPVDLERIDSCAKLPWTGLRLRPDRKHIVVIGRLSEEKGQNYLLQAVARYRADISSNFAPPIDLHIVGDGILRQELVGLARSLGIEDSVFFHGHLSDPFPLLKRCDLFVLPSLYEGLPNVLLEAMVCRIPILATNTEQGAGELLRRYPLGTLVPAGDAVALEKAMVDRFVTPDPWLSRLEPAREYVENHHSLKHWIEEMSDLFESICPQ